MENSERILINNLQGGFPISDRPYHDVAQQLGMTEAEVMTGIQGLLESGKLSRFGPLYNAQRMGGELSLVAMKLPTEEFERVASIVNAFPEVAHNYEREHEFNMWFVLATEKEEDIKRTLNDIEKATGYPVYNMPKEKEFFVGLRLDV